MKKIQDLLIKGLHLKEKIEIGELDCYLIAPSRYILFWKGDITKANIDKILNFIAEKCVTNKFSKWKTIIVLGSTNEKFSKKELLYFDGINTFTVFYLIDLHHQQIYMDKSGIFVLGLNYKRYVKQINKLLSENNCFKEDWRLFNYNEHLNDKEFQYSKFKSTAKNDHEHCEFCFKTITDVPNDNEECDNDGYYLINEKTNQTNWVCKDCFEKFKTRFNFKLKP